MPNILGEVFHACLIVALISFMMSFAAFSANIFISLVSDDRMQWIKNISNTKLLLIYLSIWIISVTCGVLAVKNMVLWDEPIMNILQNKSNQTTAFFIPDEVCNYKFLL